MSALESSISSSAAPPPDTATASPAPAAASSDSANAGTEAVASTETGAKSAQSTEAGLDQLWADTRPKVPKADTEAVKTPEPEKPKEAKPEEKPVEEEKTDEGEDDEAQAEDDPLAEVKLPTRDELKAKHPRAPKALLEEAGGYVERLAAREEQIADIGGDEGLAVAKAVNAHLLSGKVTPEAAEGVFDALADVDGGRFVSQMGQHFIDTAIADDTIAQVPIIEDGKVVGYRPDPQGRKVGEVFADALLQREYDDERGQGYGRGKIASLVEFDKTHSAYLKEHGPDRLASLIKADQDGLLDWDEINDAQGTERTPTNRERQLETQLADEKAGKLKLQDEVKQLRGSSESVAAKAQAKLQQDVAREASSIVMQRVLPVATKLGMAVAEGATGDGVEWMIGLGEVITDALNARIKETPAWTAMQALVEEGRAFTKDGQPTTIMRAKLDALGHTAEAMYKAMARKQQPLIKAAAGAITAKPSTTPNGRSAATTDEPPPAAKIQPKRNSLDEMSTDDALQELWRRNSAKERDAAMPIGR
jgi:hypothetical protein